MRKALLGLAAAVALCFCGGAFAKGTHESTLLDCKGKQFLDWAGADFQCVETSRQTIGASGERYVMRTVRDKSLPQKYVNKYASDVTGTIEKALSVYYKSAPYELGHVTLLFRTPEQKTTTEIASASAISPFECGIEIHLGAIDVKNSSDLRERFRNTIAREFFHCVQYWSFPNQMKLFGKGADWWIEGSAQYMSQKIYARPSETARLAKSFNEKSAGLPLTDMTHEAYVFFAWLEQRGPRTLHDVLRDMPEGANAGAAAQQARLRSTIGDEKLQGFAADYVDGSIKGVNGEIIGGASTPYPADMNFNQSTDVPFLGNTAFTITRARISFSNGDYLLATKAKHTPVFRMRRAEDTLWGLLPDDVTTDCNQPGKYVLAAFNLGPDANDFTMTAYRTRACVECKIAKSELDKCLIGKWLINKDALQAMLDSQLDKTARDVAAIGEASAIFHEDGTTVFTFKGVEVTGHTRSKPGAQISVTADGADTGNWTAKSGQASICPLEGKVDFKSIVDLDGPKGPMTYSQKGFLQPSAFAYACDPHQLSLTLVGAKAADGSSLQWLLHRSK